MKIGIAGIGGIGSNVARLLAQSGIRHLMIVDFDCVEASNLNRQFYSFSQIGEKKTDSLKKILKRYLLTFISKSLMKKLSLENQRKYLNAVILLLRALTIRL